MYLPLFNELSIIIPPAILAELFDVQLELIHFAIEARKLRIIDPLVAILRHTEAFFAAQRHGQRISPEAFVWSVTPDLRRLALCPNAHNIIGPNLIATLEEQEPLLKQAINMEHALSWVAYNLPLNKPITLEELRRMRYLNVTGDFEAANSESPLTIEDPEIAALLSYRSDAALYLDLETVDATSVPFYLEQLCEFSSCAMYDAALQATISMHAYHRIHPFNDPFDLTPVVLLHAIMARRNPYATGLMMPVSWYAAFKSRRFYEEVEEPLVTKGSNNNEFLTAFADRAHYTALCFDASLRLSKAILHQAKAVDDEWREKIGRVSKGSAIDLLLIYLLAAPAITVANAATAIGKSQSTTGAALERLAQAGIVSRQPLNSKESVYVVDRACMVMIDFLSRINLDSLNID